MPAFLKTVLSGAFLSALLSILLIAYGMARLFNAYIGSKIPEPSTLASRSAISAGNAGRMNTPSLFDYQMITNRNLFSSKNQIPGDEEGGVKKDIDNIPVKSTLPLNLIGTVVLQDELKSVATIEDKSSNLIVPVRIDDEITGKIKILKIETSQVIFRNLASGKKEFINLGDASPVIQLGTSAISGTQPTRKNTKDANYKIEKLSPNQFVMNRGELDRALGDFNNLLTQARAVPYMEGGQPAGFQLVQIDPGSFYEKAGFKIGDVVQGVNGDPVTDVSKALELFNALKTGTHVEIQVKTDGKASTRVYDIK
jgi:type II secretion system protein C